MADVIREQLHAFLDDTLSEAETARIQRALRDSEALQQRLRQVMTTSSSILRKSMPRRWNRATISAGSITNGH